MSATSHVAVGPTWIAFGSSAAGVGATPDATTNVRMTAADGVLTLGSDTASACRLTGLTLPTSNADAATKQYVDAVMANTHVYTAVDYITGTADLAGKGTTDTDIVPAFNADPATLTVSGTAIAAPGQGHTFDALFNSGNVISSSPITVAVGMTILIRCDAPLSGPYTSLPGFARQKLNGIWIVTAVTDQYNYVLSRRYDFKYGDQVRAGGYVFVKSGSGVSADTAWVISNDIERPLVSGGTAITASAASVGATSITLSSATGTNIAHIVNYTATTFDVAVNAIKAGQCVIIAGNYYRAATNCSSNTLTIASPGLLAPILTGSQIEIGLNLLGVDSDDAISGPPPTANMPISDSNYRIAWTQFSGSAGTTYTGTPNQITLTSTTFKIADNFNKTDFSSFDATANGAINWSMGPSVAEGFRIKQTSDVYLACNTSAKSITVGAAIADGITTIQAGNSGTSAALNIIGTGLMTGKFNVTLTDNLTDALNIKEAGTSYMQITTTNASEKITFGVDVYGAENKSFYTAGSGVFMATSDAVLKKNICTVANPLDTIERMRGVTWDWRSTDETCCGVVAQELQEIMPYAVRTGSDNLKRVNYQVLSGVFIEAIKALKAKIDELEANASGKSRDMLQAALTQLEDKQAEAESVAAAAVAAAAPKRTRSGASTYNLRRRD